MLEYLRQWETGLRGRLRGFGFDLSAHSEAVRTLSEGADMKLKLKKTQRGFARAEFKDLYNAPCSIQQSSSAEVNAIWLGCESGTHYLGTTPTENIEYDCAARMHLTQEQVKALLPLLLRFVETGELSPR